MINRIGPAWGVIEPKLGVGELPILLLPLITLPETAKTNLLEISNHAIRKSSKIEIPQILDHVLAVDKLGNAALCGADPTTVNEKQRKLSSGPLVDFEIPPSISWWNAAVADHVVLFAYTDPFLAAIAAEDPLRLGNRIALLQNSCALGVLPCPLVLQALRAPSETS